MMPLRKTLRSLLNKAGWDVHRLPPAKEPAVPIKTEGNLGFYKTAQGNFYLPLNAPNDIIINLMKEGETFEPEVVELATRYIKKGTAVLDVGANFGQMSLLFSRLVGENGVVYSFEAQKRVFDILNKTIEANQLANIKPQFCAVYFESGRTFHFPEPDFVRFGTYGSYNLPIDAVEGQEVISLKIDDLQIEKPISFMKVDVQGCDLFAMQGAVETIKKHQMPILFEFEQRFQETYRTTFQDYVDFVNSINYKFVETVLDINYLIAPK
jgi:FkbM family methyltransferase